MYDDNGGLCLNPAAAGSHGADLTTVRRHIGSHSLSSDSKKLWTYAYFDIVQVLKQIQGISKILFCSCSYVQVSGLFL